jgi:hypothetical protein
MKHRAWLDENNLPAKWSCPDALEPVMEGFKKNTAIMWCQNSKH